MLNKLLPITIIASSMAFAVSAETKLSTSYLSNNIKISNNTGSVKVSADGYGISIQYEGESGLSTSVGYSSISGSGLTFSTITTSIAYDLINDLDQDLGLGNRFQAGIGYSTTDIKNSNSSTKGDDDGVIAGLRYELALAKDLSMNLNLSGKIDDFVPAYGLGIGYKVGNGKIAAGYAFQEETIGITKFESTGFTIGYTHSF